MVCAVKVNANYSNVRVDFGPTLRDRRWLWLMEGGLWQHDPWPASAGAPNLSPL